MHVELGKTMPMTKIKQDLEHAHVVRLRQKAIENGYCTLETYFLLVTFKLGLIVNTPTCNISS